MTPAQARYSVENGQFLLPYEAVRTARDPDRALLDFLQTTYEAAAEHGDWDRAALEDDPHGGRTRAEGHVTGSRGSTREDGAGVHQAGGVEGGLHRAHEVELDVGRALLVRADLRAS
nr:DUF5996 family protein [Janibacter melonis]